MKTDFQGKYIIVTGASSGIGDVLVHRLIDAGANLYLIARSEDKLQALCREAEAKGCEARYKAIDLRCRADLEQLCLELKEQMPRVDYLFCNAGKSIHRSISNAQDRLHDYDRTMDLNYRSVVALSLALLPALKQSKGTIIYTSSVSTLYPYAPGWSAYHASKSAANVWCETADAELSRCGVRVKIAYLPLVRTPMADANPDYKNMPALSASSAAEKLLRLATSNRRTYKPWWVRLSQPVAFLLAPLVRLVYKRV